ncbi:MAG TPA: ATP-binding protein [Gemmataceae bacterium]|nr:ATP-binding protein [Gemmataceae bacterium]
MSRPVARLCAPLKSFTQAASVGVALLGMLALLGWFLDAELLKSLIPGRVAMNPATAFAFVLAGGSLWLLRAEPMHPSRRCLGAACAFLVALLGLLKLGDYLAGWDLGLDQLLFRSQLGDNRIAPNTALNFLLIGSALLLVDVRTRRGVWPAQALALVAALVALIGLVGHTYGIRSLYGIASYIPMALNTAVGFALLCAGVLCARPDRGLMAVLTSETTGGFMARRLLPAAVIVPVGLGWLRLVGEQAGLYDMAFGVAILTASNILTFAILVLFTTSALNRTDAERRRIEAEVRRLNGELEKRVAQRTAELAEANRDLAQKNQENELFVYSVSHDLRSPLVNLEGFSQELGAVCQDLRAILADSDLPPAVRQRGLALLDQDMAESIHFIQTAVKRLSGIIDALLRLSRAGRVEYQRQRVDIRLLVGRIIESMRLTIDQRGATVHVGDLPPAWGDPTALEQVFANLISNALNYLDPERPGLIEVGSAAPEHGGADGLQTYYVRDNGLGIPEEYQHKVFQAFQRVHPRAAPGEGMGLTIVRRIVERHQGKIWVASRPGEGSTFFVALPAAARNGRPMDGSQVEGSLPEERRPTSWSVSR